MLTTSEVTIPLSRSRIIWRALQILGFTTLFASSHAQVQRLSLEEAVQLAIRQSPSVAAVESDVLAANEAARTAAAKRAPKLSANGFAASGNYGAIYPSAQGVDPAYSLLVPSGALLDANLTLMAPLFTGGQIDGEIRSARLLAQAAFQDLREAQAEAAFRTEEAYFRALLAAEKVKAAKARIEASVEIVHTTQAQFDAGHGIEASVQRAEAELAQSQRMLTMASGESEKALLDLKAETGLDLGESISLSDALDSDVTVKELSLALEDSLANRGVVLAARARFEASKSDVKAAEGSQRPQVYGVAMADTSNQSINRGGSVGLTVSIPLFDGGQRRAETSRVRSLRDRAAAMVHLAELTSQKEVRQAFIDLATSEANVKSSQSSVQSAKSALDVATLRVSSGKGILVEQLDALQSLTQAQADLASSMYDRRLAYSRVQRATGTTSVKAR